MYKSQEELLISSDARELVRFIKTLRCRGCTHYVGKTPYAYDGEVYCEDCGTHLNEEEKRRRQEEIEQLEKRLAELKSM